MQPLARPRVARLLAGAWDRRLTLVVAGSGYGKTTALEALAPRGWVAVEPTDRDVTQLAAKFSAALGLSVRPGSAPTVGALDRRALADQLAVDFCARVAEIDECLLVVDDAGQLGADEVAPAWQFVRTVCRQAPAQLHLVVSGRRMPDGSLVRAADGNVLRVGAEDLAFGVDELESLFTAAAQARGEPVGELADAGFTATAGWPAAAIMLRDALGRARTDRVPAAIDELIDSRDAPWRPIARSFLADEPAESLQILQLASVIGAIDADVVGHCLGSDRVARLADLLDRGALLPSRPAGFVDLSPVLRGLVDLLGADLDGWVQSAAQLFAASGLRVRALGCARQLGAEAVRNLLATTGRSMVAAGESSLVVRALTEVSIDDDPVMLSLRGEAQQAAGDWPGAIESFRIAVQAAGGRLAAAAAWRFAALLYMYGEPDEALEVLLSAEPASGPSDAAQLLAWKASAYWAKGQITEATSAAEESLELASAARDSSALAAASGVRALICLASDDVNAARHHLGQALSAAEAAGDGVQIVRVRSNLCGVYAELGDLAASTREADLAVETARPFGGVVAGLALGNRAHLMLRLGRVDDARSSAAEAIEQYQLSNWRAAGAALLNLGHADLARGDVAKARHGYARAIELSDQIEDTHTGSSALAAQALALAVDDPEAASELAQRAVEQSVGWNRAPAHYSMAYAAAAGGDLTRARSALSEAVAAATANNDPRSLALAFELEAVLSDPADEAGLVRAAEQWSMSGDEIGIARCRLLQARVAADAVNEQVALDALRDRGLAAEVGTAALLEGLRSQTGGDGSLPPPEVRTLGRFQVVRAGVVVAPSEWQSRKARDLVKLLVARQGQPVTRDQAAEVLWPDDRSDGIGNRLSVLLTTIRRVFDPAREHPPDHYLSADDNALGLRIDRLDIDVLGFLDEVGLARDLVATGDVSTAEETARAAQERYRGDFLEEDVYADWSVDLREQAKDAMLWTHHQLAAAATARGDHEAALTQLRRLLERDAYDETAWLDLVRALRALRRHSEARRQHARYCHYMDELDAQAVPYADISGP